MDTELQVAATGHTPVCSGAHGDHMRRVPIRPDFPETHGCRTPESGLESSTEGIGVTRP